MGLRYVGVSTNTHARPARGAGATLKSGESTLHATRFCASSFSSVLSSPLSQGTHLRNCPRRQHPTDAGPTDGLLSYTVRLKSARLMLRVFSEKSPKPGAPLRAHLARLMLNATVLNFLSTRDISLRVLHERNIMNRPMSENFWAAR